jgi:hypothetical protein
LQLLHPSGQVLFYMHLPISWKNPPGSYSIDIQLNLEKKYIIS